MTFQSVGQETSTIPPDRERVRYDTAQEELSNLKTVVGAALASDIHAQGPWRNPQVPYSVSSAMDVLNIAYHSTRMFLTILARSLNLGTVHMA